MEALTDLVQIIIGNHYKFVGGKGLLDGKIIEIIKKELVTNNDDILVTYGIMDEFMNLSKLRNRFLIGSDFHLNLKEYNTKG